MGALEPLGTPDEQPAASPSLRVVPGRLTDPDARLLVDQVQAEYTSLYGSPDDSPLVGDELGAPHGALFLGYLGAVAVAMGGWRRRDDIHALGRSAAAEVKRMYVAPAARRRGHARHLLEHLERTAGQAGADLMVLETGTMQPEAIAMYVAAGYQRIPGFGYYRGSPLSRCFGKPV